jgi:hypothetical protein
VLTDRNALQHSTSFGIVCTIFCKSLIPTSIARRDYTLRASNLSNYAESARN